MRTQFKIGDEVIIDVGFRGRLLRGVKGKIHSAHFIPEPSLYDFYVIDYLLNKEQQTIVLSNKDLYTKEEYLKLELDKTL